MRPVFRLKALDGKDVSLGELLENGPVVAAFFKISCPVCQFTFPFLERMYKRYGGDGATFLGISQDDARATKDFAKEFGVTFPMLLDEKAERLPGFERLWPHQCPHDFSHRTGRHRENQLHGFRQKGFGIHRRGSSRTQENRPGRAFPRQTSPSPPTNLVEVQKTRSGLDLNRRI